MDMKNEKEKYVWYVGYGSNLNQLRMIRQFGNFDPMPYSVTISPYQFENKPYYLPHPIYFANAAGYSSKWGYTGVAFLDYKTVGFAFGRAYKMPKYLFEYLRDVEGRGNNWYNKVIHLGHMEDGIEIVTLTNRERLDSLAPCLEYLNTIEAGLTEIGLNRDEAELYIKLVLNRKDYKFDDTPTNHFVKITNAIETKDGERELLTSTNVLTVAQLDFLTSSSLQRFFKEKKYKNPETNLLFFLDPEEKALVMQLADNEMFESEEEFYTKALEVIGRSKDVLN